MFHPETSRASRNPLRVAIPAFACALTLAAAADAQAQAIDILFVVDESGSMETEHAFLDGFVSRLDQNLEEASFTDRRYGLFGFGGFNDRGLAALGVGEIPVAEIDRALEDIGRSREDVARFPEEIGRSFPFQEKDCANLDSNGFCSSHTKSWATTSEEFVNEAFPDGNPRLLADPYGGHEDGWAALVNSLPVYWDEKEDEDRGPDHARIVVLVTDEHRSPPPFTRNAFTREDARTALDEAGASLTAILNMRDSFALAVREAGSPADLLMEIIMAGGPDAADFFMDRDFSNASPFPTTDDVPDTYELLASNGKTVFALDRSDPSASFLDDELEYDPDTEPFQGAYTDYLIALPGVNVDLLETYFGVRSLAIHELSYDDYGQLVYPFPQPEDFTPEGCIADLNILRREGAYATAFADIMLQCILFQAEALTSRFMPTTPADTLLFLNVYRDTAEIMMRSALAQITMGQTADGLQDPLATPENLLEKDNLLEVPGLRGYLSLRNLDGDFQRGANNKPFDYDGWSVLFGTDHTRVDSETETETSAGVALSFHSIDTHVRGRFGPAAQEGEPLSPDTLGTLAAEGKSITAYAVRRSESDGYWKAQVHLSANDYRQKRLDDEGEIYRARPDGLSLKARLERGWETERELNDDRNSTLHLMPFAAIEASHYEINNFLEDNDGVAVNTFDDDRIALQVGTEVLLNRSHGGLDTFFSARVMAEVGIFGDEDMPTLVTPDRGAGTAYVDPYEELDGQRLSVALSTGVKLRDDAHAYLRYVGDYSSHDSQRGIEAGLTVRF